MVRRPSYQTSEAQTKNLGSLAQKRRPKECVHISEGLAWLGSNSRERRRQAFPTIEAQKDGLL